MPGVTVVVYTMFRWGIIYPLQLPEDGTSLILGFNGNWCELVSFSLTPQIIIIYSERKLDASLESWISNCRDSMSSSRLKFLFTLLTAGTYQARTSIGKCFLASIGNLFVFFAHFLSPLAQSPVNPVTHRPWTETKLLIYFPSNVLLFTPLQGFQYFWNK